MREQTPEETQPLLSSEEDWRPIREGTQPPLIPDQDSASPPGSSSGSHTEAYRRRVIRTCFATALLIDCGALFLHAPQTSILESIICQQHYGHLSKDGDCTASPVQAELAIVDQLFNTFSRLPGLMVAIPFGIMADHRGRRPVLLLCILGTLLQDIMSKCILWWPDVFPPRLIWLAPVGTLVGGGDAVASFMVYLVIADVAPSVDRASLFFLLTAFGLVGEAIGTPISAFLLSIHPWVPYAIYTVLLLFAGIVPGIFLPETLPKLPMSSTAAVSPVNVGMGASMSAQESPAAPAEGTLASRLRPLISRNAAAVMLSFFVSALGRQSSNFLLQYTRQRFDMRYDKASFLMSLRAFVNLILLLAGLPLLIKFLNRRKMNIPAKDLLVCRLSIFFLAIGSLIIAAAPAISMLALGIVVFAMGSGFPPAARSLATAFVSADDTGLLYSMLALMQSAGGLLAGPLLAVSFRCGLGLGRAWTGIPFAAMAFLFGLGFVAIAFVRI